MTTLTQASVLSVSPDRYRPTAPSETDAMMKRSMFFQFRNGIGRSLHAIVDLAKRPFIRVHLTHQRNAEHQDSLDNACTDTPALPDQRKHDPGVVDDELDAQIARVVEQIGRTDPDAIARLECEREKLCRLLANRTKPPIR
jgi:hypothetical protein